MATQEEKTSKDLWDEMDAADAGNAVETAPVTAPKEVAKPDAAPVVDEWAGVPDVVKKHISDYAARFQNIDERFGSLRQLEDHAKSAIGKVAGLQQELVKIGRQTAQSVKSAPSAVQINEAVDDPAEWKRLKEDFPEWASGMDKRMDAKIAAIRIQTPDFGKEFEPLKAEIEKFRSQSAEIEALKKANEGMKDLMIEIQHPGWKQDVKTDQFKKWFMVQPPEVRTLGGSENPLDAIRVLSLYKNKPDASKIVEQRRTRLAQAAEVKGSGASVPAKRFEDMTAEEQWKEMDRQAKSRGDVW